MLYRDQTDLYRDGANRETRCVRVNESHRPFTAMNPLTQHPETVLLYQRASLRLSRHHPTHRPNRVIGQF
ncbi:MAG: hypothetical protein ABIR55_23520 [Burkholderiaceae bacterium]